MAEKQDYVYAVARIRSKELSLFGAQTLEQLMACKNYEDCLHVLSEKGWDVSSGNAGEILSAEREKTWKLIRELIGEDLSAFDVFLYANDYHNLKAAVKEVCMDSKTPNIYFESGTIDPSLILKAVRDQDFTQLPEQMRGAAQEACRVLLQNHDGQMCDVVIDRAALEAVLNAGMASDNEVLQKYAELTVASADIRIAVRSARTGKPLEFLEHALAPCSTLDVKKLARAAASGVDAVLEYLAMTPYAGAVPAVRKSVSSFERWCDDLLMEQIRPQKYNPFTIAPVAAYLLARENEIKTVRIILSGKLNRLSDESVRERLRETYV
ncbi:V-type ATP synthase subunit C [Caproiciproducens sp. NJN-50]|uniref:V-type ATPase subunit n=1 Tax=Acutalibacteraceae TaxID=3082771 RepID=UPI000FFE1E49|nr:MULTISPECIES: V-type ATPase subunit [Acutalibacteraceae]QAT50636.1 V-type ATP synthase subunit C [Caproiciproducens sp. NJN-50]